MTELLNIFNAITCHAWSPDKKCLVLCPNNNEIHLYYQKGTAWEAETVLAEHDGVVMGIDWDPNSNRIVTCSLDRNAYVWTLTNDTWKPILVILRLSYGATQVKWSPLGNKFAVASSAKCVAVCSFDKENDWWVSKIVKKHKSTVLSISWHPNNVHLLTGSSDMKCRVFSAYLKGEDQKPTGSAFGDKLTFGECLAEYNAGGWVHSVLWSPSGNRFAYVAHDSSITFVDVSNGAPGDSQCLKLPFLPLSDLIFVNENCVVAGGHDCQPLVFNNTNGTWAFTNLIEQVKAAAVVKTSGTKAAFDLFKNKTDVGQDSKVQTLITLHQNCITSLQPYKTGANSVSEFTSSALDGKVCVWKAPL